MARLIARRDAEDGYVFIRSGDAYPVPEDCRDVIKRNGGEFSGTTKEWRVSITRGPDLVAIMRAWGHQVIAVDAHATREARRLLECAVCGQPYPTTKAPIVEESCTSCADVLQLVPAHECDDECRALACQRSA